MPGTQFPDQRSGGRYLAERYGVQPDARRRQLAAEAESLARVAPVLRLAHAPQHYRRERDGSEKRHENAVQNAYQDRIRDE
jgi:hypothetical protein